MKIFATDTGWPVTELINQALAYVPVQQNTLQRVYPRAMGSGNPMSSLWYVAGRRQPLVRVAVLKKTTEAASALARAATPPALDRTTLS